MSPVVVSGKTMAYCLQINAGDVKPTLLCCHLMPSDIIKLARMSVSGQEAEKGKLLESKIKKNYPLFSASGARVAGWWWRSVNFSPIFVIQLQTNKTPAAPARPCLHSSRVITGHQTIIK